MNEWQKDKKNQRQTSLALHWKAILLLYNNGYVMLWSQTKTVKVIIVLKSQFKYKLVSLQIKAFEFQIKSFPNQIQANAIGNIIQSIVELNISLN